MSRLLILQRGTQGPVHYSAIISSSILGRVGWAGIWGRLGRTSENLGESSRKPREEPGGEPREKPTVEPRRT